MDSTHDGAPAALAPLLDAAHAAADAAAPITLGGFRAGLAVADKSGGAAGGFDPVTRADREAERAVRETLAARCPGIGFTGEESAADAAGADGGRRWSVDPIDGTRAYVAGVPVWGTLVALVDGDAPVLGLLDQPYLGERFVGHPAGAVLHARAGRRELATRTGRELSRAVLCATDPAMFAPAERARFERVAGRASIVRWGTDCYGYAMLAAGAVDAVVESGLSPWDVAALVPIVRGAGGVVTGWDGAPSLGPDIVATGSEALHAEVLERLAGGR